MGKGARILERMRNNPRDWRISDIETLCRDLGISCEKPARGSHYKVSHPTQVEILTIPGNRPIKPVYIRKLVAFGDAVVGASR
jgi:hypothetical protein